MNTDLKMVWLVWYGMVWYGMVWYGMVWYGMVGCTTEATGASCTLMPHAQGPRQSLQACLSWSQACMGEFGRVRGISSLRQAMLRVPFVVQPAHCRRACR